MLMSFHYKGYELRVTFIVRVASYFSHANYELLIFVRVTTYFLHTNYRLLCITSVTNDFYYTSYKLLCKWVANCVLLHKLQSTFIWVTGYVFFARFTSCFLHASFRLFHELRVAFHMQDTGYCLLHELDLLLYIRVTSCN